MTNQNPTNQQKLAAYNEGLKEEIELLFQETEFRTKRIKIFLKEIEVIKNEMSL